MIINEIQNKKEWEDFLSGVDEKTFLQSWNWGEFQVAQGFKIWRLGISENSVLLAVALVVKIRARRGTYLLIQHGPIISDGDVDKPELLKLFMEKLSGIGKQEGASFIRMNPLWKRDQENIELLRKSGFRKALMHANAYDATWKLDISEEEKDLLARMRKTTRYLIHQTEKNLEIIIERSEDIKNLPAYLELNRQVAIRQKFVPFSDTYIKNEFEVFARDHEVLLFFGKYRGEIVAGSLIIFWQGGGYYHQAASLSKYSKLSIPYLLQWEAIKEAKKRGCRSYDFWGYVNPKTDPEHPWAGPTLFKMGYGGEAYEYVATQDYVLSPKYWLTYVFEAIRKKKRNL
jgi:lipid II:glycine glycyltransferase (peptidoglycan interpeptide bridge formation enzyme)